MIIRVVTAAVYASLIAAPAVIPFDAARAATTATADERYWGCDAGFDFQVSGESGRCLKAAATEYAPPLACPRINTPLGPVGASLRIDANGQNDVCATTVGVTFTGEVTCGLGWTMDRRTGADRCFKREPAVVRQPTRVVLR